MPAVSEDQRVFSRPATSGRSDLGEFPARPLRVLHLVAYGNLAGTEMTTSFLAKGQAVRGLQPTVAILYHGGPIEKILEGERIPTVRIGATKGRVVLVWRRLVDLIRTTKPHVVHAHDLRWWSAILGRIVHRGPHLLTIHHQMVVGRDAWRWRLKYRIAQCSYDFFSAVSGATLRSVTEAVSLPRERCAVIPNGIPVEAFRSNRPRSAYKARYGCDSDSPLVGFMGRLSAEKGVDDFLRTCREILRLEPRAQFWVIGDGEDAGALISLAKTLGLQRRVIFWGDRLDATEMLLAMDALLITSHRETFSLVAVEAMAAEAAVLGFVPSQGGLLEVIRSPEMALLLPERDPARLADLVVEVLRNPNIRTCLTAVALDHVRNHVNLSRMTDRYLQLYARLLRIRQASATEQPESPADPWHV